MNLKKTAHIVYEKALQDHIGCQMLLKSLKKTLKDRGMEYAVQERESWGPGSIGSQGTFPDGRCGMDDQTPVFVIGMDPLWVEDAVNTCNGRGIIPVLLSVYPVRPHSGRYVLLCPDTDRLCEELDRKLRESGRHRIALYGINPVSAADRGRTQSLGSIIHRVEDIYPNTSGLEPCFRSFEQRAEEYDAVICTNGYAAVSLAKKLSKEARHILEHMAILSFEEVLKHSRYSSYLTFIHLMPEAYGPAALAAAELVSAAEHINRITVTMDYHMEEIPHQEREVRLSAEGASYEDPEILSMAKMEQLLQGADDLDHHILAMLLSGATYASIADTCYLTERNVKYRVKKYMDICGCKGKKELLEFVQEYLQ